MRAQAGTWVLLAVVSAVTLTVTFLAGLPPVWTLVILIVVLAIAAIPIVLTLASKRTTRIQQGDIAQWAEESGFDYVEGGEDKPEWLRFLPWRPHGAIDPVLTGEYEGRPLTVAEYYRTRTVSGRPTRESMVVAVIPLENSYPDLVVDVATSVRPTQSPRLRTGDEAFDRRFRVLSDDPEAARELLGEPMREAMLAHGVPLWEIHANNLIVLWSQGLRVIDMEPRLAAVAFLAQLIEPRAVEDSDESEEADAEANA